MFQGTFVLFSLAVCMISQIESSCYVNPPKDCVYDNKIYKDGEEFDAIERCMKCSCIKGGVRCCGYGNFIFEHDLPEECKIIEPKDCHQEAVLKNDESQACPFQSGGVW